MIDSWNYDRSQHSHSERCNLRAIITVLSYQVIVIACYYGPKPPAAPARFVRSYISLLSWARSQVSGLWLGKIMKAGVEWLLTTATSRAELRARIMTERAAILLRTFNYLGDGHRVTSVIETYICTKQKIMSIMCLLSVWESQLCLLKNVLKSCLYNNEVRTFFVNMVSW